MSFKKSYRWLTVPKTYLIRHEILELLSKNWNIKKYKNQRDLNVSSSLVFETFKDLKQSELRNHLEILEKTKEIFSEVGIDNNLAYHTTYEGLDLYLTKRYITKGRQERFNNLYDVGKNALVICGLGTFFLSTYQGCNNKKYIETLQTELKDQRQELMNLKLQYKILQTNVDIHLRFKENSLKETKTETRIEEMSNLQTKRK